MEEKLTHWKKLHNPDYLGAYSLDPGKELILTIKSVQVEKVQNPDGKKEDCMVMKFAEPQKPMIINATNCKTITKLYKTPYVEQWTGRKIQLFVDNVKAFGDVVEALRIRPFTPKQETVSLVCSDCGGKIVGFEKFTAEQISQSSYSKYSKSLCVECAKKMKDSTTKEIIDPLGGSKDVNK